MNDLEKAAENLAVRTVCAREMRKQALSPAAQQALRYGLTGAGVGGGVAGLASYLSGRRRKRMLLDTLLGVSVGGAGAAAYPILKSIGEGPEDPPGFFERYGESFKTAPGIARKVGLVGGGAALGTAGSRVLEELGETSTELAEYQKKVRGGISPEELMKKKGPWLGKPEFKTMTQKFKRLPRGALRGFARWPSGRNIRGGAWGAALGLVADALSTYMSGPPKGGPPA